MKDSGIPVELFRPNVNLKVSQQVYQKITEKQEASLLSYRAMPRKNVSPGSYEG